MKWLVPVAVALAALVAPWFAGSAARPAVAPAAAQLLAPATALDEVALVGGGFVRAAAIRIDDGRVSVRDAAGWRTLPVAPAGAVTHTRAWLGTDADGRDVLSRIAAGARVSITIALLASFVALLIGGGLGLAEALAPRGVSWLAASTTDAALSIPRLLVLLALAVGLARVPGGLALAIGGASWMELARVVAAAARSIESRPFVMAARGAGASRLRVALAHVLPNLAPLLVAALPVAAAEAVLLEATLSYLGVGGGDSWGRIIADGQRLLPEAWWIVVFPGLLLTTVAAALHHGAAPIEG